MASSDSSRADDSRVTDLMIAIVFCTAASTISFVGRIWGRSLSAMRWGRDDIFMALAVFGGWAISADNAVAIHYGFGHHIEYLSSSDKRINSISLWTFFFLQIVTTTFLKMAILGLYRRTFVAKGFNVAVSIVTAIILADSVGLFFAVCFYCIPAAHLWDPSRPGKCVNRVLFTTLASSSLLLTDLVLYLMPMPVIWKLQMTTRRKIELTFIFLLGGFICITRTIQLVDSSRLDFADETWSNVDVAIWNMIEVHVGCVAANIPLMGPLFIRLGGKIAISKSKRSIVNGRSGSEISSTKHTLRDHIGVEHGFRRMEDHNSGVELAESTMAATIGNGKAHSNDTIEMGSLGLHDIMVRQDLEQTYQKSVRC